MAGDGWSDFLHGCVIWLATLHSAQTTTSQPAIGVETCDRLIAVSIVARPIVANQIWPSRTGAVNAVLDSVIGGYRQSQLRRNVIVEYGQPMGLKPVPLPPTSSVTKKAPETARLQRTYRRLMELGLKEEAMEVAAQLGYPSNDVVQAMALKPLSNGNDPLIHKVFFRPGEPQTFSTAQPTEWNAARQTLLSCQFEGTSLLEVARFLHESTGVTIHVAVPDSAPPKVTIRSLNQSLEDTLGAAVRSCGCDFTIRGQSVVIVRPLDTALRDSGLPIRR